MDKKRYWALASLETINFKQKSHEIHSEQIIWNDSQEKNDIKGLPQIIWNDNTPWREANLWALQLARKKDTNLKTVVSAIKHIYAYANWLEAESIDWWHFPAREADRCLIRFRGYLIKQRDNNSIASSTTTHRMNSVIRFYRWLHKNNLISPEWPMWGNKTIGIRIQDQFGFQRTLIKDSTDLAIRNSPKIGGSLEDGLLPVPSKHVASIIQFAQEHASDELSIMLQLGFSTGMRIGTICDLKTTTVHRASPNPWLPDWHLLAVGPNAHPAVHTKFGVTGQVWISNDALNLLQKYIHSTRRLKRQALASEKNRDLVFLNRFGKPYATEGSDSSQALNVEMGRLKRAGIAAGISAFYGFHFHRSRSTFGTELARIALRYGGTRTAIQLTMVALLHKHESTTLKYIRFIEQHDAASELSDEYTKKFLGHNLNTKLKCQ